MNLEEVVAEIEEAMTWRVNELRHLANSISSNSDEDLRTVVRKASVVMVYAHLEGFFKAALGVYIKAVNAERLPVGELDEALAVAALRPEWKSLANGEPSPTLSWSVPPKRTSGLQASTLRRVEFLCRLDEILHSEATLDEDALTDTESNLQPNVVRKLLYQLGLSTQDVESWDSALGELVNLRNSIAHGSSRRPVTESELDRLTRGARDVMNGLRTLILQALVAQHFKREELRIPHFAY